MPGSAGADAGAPGGGRRTAPPGQRLRPWTDQPFFHAKRVGAEFRTRGVARCAVGRPDGVFAEWAWDGSSLTICNDRYGFFPLFYAARGDELWVSPSLFKLVAEGAPRDLDDAALAVFLRMGGFVGGDTPFAAIRQVPPAASFVWRGEPPAVRGEYAIARTQHLSRDAAVDGFVTLFREAIRRTAPDPARVVVPLTGGRDSRHIVLELCAQGRRPARCLTARPHPPKAADDVDVAAHLAHVLGLEHLVLDQPPSHFQSEWEKNAHTHLCTVEHAWALPIAEYFNGQGFAVYDGIAGDSLSQSQFLNATRVQLFERGDVAALAEDLLGPEGYLPALLPAPVYRRLNRDLGLARLGEEVARHLDAPNGVGSFRIWNRTRRTIALAPYGVLAQVADVYAPYLDPDLFDFLGSLPGSMLLDRRLHTDAIARAYPRYADVPYEVKGARAPATHAAHFRRLGAEVLRAAGRAPGGLLRRGPLAARLARAMLLGAYNAEVASLGGLATYLIELETVANDAFAR
jgi:asparagine synthase (glutamine-hydrolysing)